MINATDTNLDVPSNIYGGKNIVMMSLIYSLAILGIPGNLVAMIVLSSSESLRSKPINRFIIHQAFIDFLSCCYTIFEEALNDLPTLMTQPGICHLFVSKVTGGVIFYASTYNMVFLSIERYQAIINPLQYDAEKVLRRLPFVFIGTWLICIVALSILPATTVVKHGACLPAYHMVMIPVILEYYTPHCLVVSFVIPIAIMVFCYSRMYLAMRTSLKLSAPSSEGSKAMKQPSMKRSMREPSGDKSASVHKSRLAQINILQTCVTLATLTSACWLTNVSYLIMLISGFYGNLANDHVAIGFLLLLVNACLNPYVSIIRYDAFKVQLRSLVGIKAKKGATEASTSKVMA